MIIKNKRVVSTLGLMLILILFLGLCLSTISYKDELFVWASVFLFGVGAIIYGFIFCFSRNIGEYFKQLHAINIVIAVIILGIISIDWSNIHFCGYQKIILGMFLMSSFFCEIIFMRGEARKEKLKKLSIFNEIIHEYVGLFIILLVFFFLSIHLGGTTYKWDSYLYYITCQELDAFSLSNLAIYGHMAQAFGLLLKLGQVFINNLNVAVHFVNVFVAMSGISAFYGIMKYMCPKAEKLNLCLATGAYAFSAYVLGLVNYLNLDYYCACLFPVVVYFMLKKQWILHIIAAFFFCFTKEPAIIIYAGLCLGYLLTDTKRMFEEDGLKAINKVFFSIKYWYMAVIGILWFITYRLLGPWSAGEGGVSFDFGFVMDKIKVMYLMNFSWYFSLLFLLAVIFALIEKKNNPYQIYVWLLVPLIFFTLFNCVFRTANHYRYNAITMFVLCCVGMIYVLNIEKKSLSRIILSVSCVVALTASYLSIDPITNSLFEKVFVGNGYIWSTSEDMRLGDSAIYNKQMLGAENALNQAFKAAIEDGDEIVLQAQNNNIWYADGLTDFHLLEEGGSYYSFIWDEQISQRVSIETESTRTIEILQTADIDDIAGMVESDSFDKTYSYVSISDTENYLFQEIDERYSVIDEEEYEYGDWKYKRMRFRKVDKR